MNNETVMNPLISVIIPVYNSSKYLKKCVDSVLEQSFQDFEIILVDDGSSDGSEIICDSYSSQNSRVKVIHQNNQGLSAARNAGLDMSKGRFISFVDSDDYVLPDYLEYLFTLLESSDDYFFSSCCHYVVRNGSKTRSFFSDTPVVLDRKEAFQSVLYHGAVDVCSWAKLFRRELFETVRFPEGRLYEDTYIFGKILNLSDRIIVGNEPKYFYVQHRTSIVNGSFSPMRLTYIDSVEELVAEAKLCSDNLEKGCTRRITHAYLSVLRYMENCPEEYKGKRDDLRAKVLENAGSVLHDPMVPQRDFAAIHALRVGYIPFFALWKLYNCLR